MSDELEIETPVCGALELDALPPFLCDLPVGHDGEHSATVDGETLARWPQESEPASTT